MPKLPDDRREPNTERPRRVPRTRFPLAQPPYREARHVGRVRPGLTWEQLDRLPAGVSTRRGLTTR